MTHATAEIIASARNWIEGAAVQQLERTAQLPGTLRAVGMPDLHPGKGSPIGAAFLSEGVAYPALRVGDSTTIWSAATPCAYSKDPSSRRGSSLHNP